MKNMRGQSMAEFAAGLSAFGMLALGSVSVVGLQEVQRRAVLSAREAAFQQEWLGGRSSAGSIRDQIAREHFDDPALANATGGSRMLQPPDVDLSSTVGPTPGTGATAAQFLFRPLRTTSGFLGAGFDLDEGGFLAGSISTRIAGAGRMPEPFNTLQLRFDQPFALLGDDWSASGPPHVARRAGGLVPTNLLSPLAAIWRPLSAPLALFEPSLANLCFGLIEPDHVPEDRLGPGIAQRTPTCR